MSVREKIARELHREHFACWDGLYPESIIWERSNQSDYLDKADRLITKILEDLPLLNDEQMFEATERGYSKPQKATNLTDEIELKQAEGIREAIKAQKQLIEEWLKK